VADASPDVSNIAAAQTTTLCLINAQRTRHGLRALVARRELGVASTGLAKDMVARDFFSHVDPDGTTMTDRLRRARWIPSSGSWNAGENIAWGGGYLATPRQIVTSWMASAGHRANILTPAFREAGVGIVSGAPQPGITMSAATYVTDFGFRSVAARGNAAKHRAARR
jgi:uncharacterized protein YkwD